MLWAEWWVWMIAGIVLGILEVMAPGFILLGFAIGAAVTGFMLLIGILGGSLATLLFVFAVVSLIAWYALRQFIGVRTGQTKLWDRDINDG